MSDFLTRLIERTQGVVPVAQPIIPSMFAMMTATSRDYQQNSSLNDESVNAPTNLFVHSPKILPRNFVPPQENLSLTMPGQPLHKIHNVRFAQPEHIESEDSEQVESVNQGIISGKIDSGDFELASSPVNHRIQINERIPKKNFSGDHESSTNTIVSELDQNTTHQPEYSPDLVNVLANTPEAELDQNTIQQQEHLPHEKLDASGESIDSQQANAFREVSEEKSDQNIDQQTEHLIIEKREIELRGRTEAKFQHEITHQPKHSFYEEKNAGKSIDSAQENALQGRTESKPHQYIVQKPERLFDEERNASERSNHSGKESAEVQSYKTYYPKKYSPSKIGLQQSVGKESSPQESIIKVTIGRVEVRAIMPTVPTAPAPRARSQSPILSLNDYLKQRNEGKR